MGTGAQIGKFLGAHWVLAPQPRNHHRTRHDQLLAFLVAERDRPTTKLVEAFDRVDQVPEKCVPAHFSVGDHFHAGANLQGNRLVHRSIFRLLEGRVAQLAGFVPLPRFLQVRRPQETAHHIASIHAPPPRLRIWSPAKSTQRSIGPLSNLHCGSDNSGCSKLTPQSGPRIEK